VHKLLSEALLPTESQFPFPLMTEMYRSLRWYEAQGCTVDIVEKFIPHTNIKKDLFGMFDLLVIFPDSPKELGVQVTSRAHITDRIKKLKAEPRLRVWCQGHRQAVVHGWKDETLREVFVTP
jgi:hypothetical protein